MTGIIGDHRRPAGVAQQLQPRDPRKVGPYWLLGRLGSGGMGQVFLGRSPGGRLIAVKWSGPNWPGKPNSGTGSPARSPRRGR